jgi:hypothetical protein
MKQWLAENAGTKWSGSGELWLDPEGNKAEHYECDLHVEKDAIHYSWLYEGECKDGSIFFNEHGAKWEDSWHQKDAVQCAHVPEAWGLFTIGYAYQVPDNPDWGWRIKLSERPDGSLVLQMTNITPWGEEGRAVRMVFDTDVV